MTLQVVLLQRYGNICILENRLGFLMTIESISFDLYCSQFGKTTDILTKDIVCGWISYEIASDRHCMENKVAAIRAFARHIGDNSHILPADRIPKTPNFIPYILSDEELVRLFSAIDAARKG